MLCQEYFRRYFVSDCTEGGRLELQWLMEPLTGFADRVQYPLETPSRCGPQHHRMRAVGDLAVRLITTLLVHFDLVSSSKTVCEILRV
jgi:hypothetical protein